MIITGFFIGIVLNAAIMIYLFKRNGHTPPDMPWDDVKRGLDAKALRPYAKKSGKKSPKVNDDGAAWRKENEL